MSRNIGNTTCRCGLTFSFRPELGRRSVLDLLTGEDYLKAIDWEDCPYKPLGYDDKDTMFGKIVCPICLSEYVGWYCPPDYPQYDGPEWNIYDMSYWSSYNDEPGESDVANLRDAREVLSSLQSYTTREKRNA